MSDRNNSMTKIRALGTDFGFLVFVLLLIAAALPPCALRMHLFTIFTGVPPLLCLRRRWGLVTLMLLALPVGLLVWSVLTLLTVTVSAGAAAWTPWFVVAALALCVARHILHGGGTALRLMPTRPEICALFIVFAAAAALLYLSLQNGYFDKSMMRVHIWMGNDTMYMCALGEQMLRRGGLPNENPFIAGVANYYPCLCHCGLAGLTRIGGDCVLAGATTWMVTHGALSLGLMALVCGRLGGAVRRWRGALFGVLALLWFATQRYDLLLLMQTNFLVMPVLMLAMWLLFDLRARVASDGALLLVCGLLILLILSHTVSAVALFIMLAFVCLTMLARRGRRHAAAFLGLFLCVAAALFLFMNHYPYSGMKGYLARGTTMSISRYLTMFQLPLLIPLFCGFAGLFMLRGAALRRAAFVLGCFFMFGALYTIKGMHEDDLYSTWFIMFNAPRFWQMGLLFTFPVFALAYRARHWAPALPLIAVVASAFIPFSVATVAWTAFNDAYIEFPTAREDSVLRYLRTETDPRDVVTSPFMHLLPAVTGLPELAVDSDNLWGLDTLPPQEFRAMRGEYEELWNSDEMTTVTPERRAEIVKKHHIRWMVVFADERDPGGAQLIAAMLRRYPKGMIEPFMYQAPMALFRVRSEALDAVTSGAPEMKNEDQ